MNDQPTKPAPQPLVPKQKESTGQRRSLERGSATHKKNPGKRPSQGG